MADLVSAHYNQLSPFWAILGGAANLTNTNQPVYTNATYLGFSGATDNSTTAVTTAKANAVLVPVDVGAVITKASIVVGATAQATSTHSNGALYTGGVAAPAIIGTQSTNDTTANGGAVASTLKVFTFGSPVMITAAMAPQGYIYFSFGFTATTAPSLLTCPTPAAVFYQWPLVSATANPLAFAANYTGGGAVAPATLAAAGSATAAASYIVFLQ
jgi:hypothetical protein